MQHNPKALKKLQLLQPPDNEYYTIRARYHKLSTKSFKMSKVCTDKGGII